MFKVTFDDSGLRRLTRNLESIASKKTVSFAELFTSAFMGRHTQFASFEDLIEASGFKVESTEDFLAIPDEDWDRFIAANTSFRSWKEMQQAAGAAWLKRQIEKR